MSKLNISEIIQITNDKIGYDNFKKEEHMRKLKMKNMLLTSIGICILTIGTISVDALTNNSIKNAIDDFMKIKVNDKDYNAKCIEKEDGTMSCKVGDTGFEYEITDEGKKYDYDIDIKNDDENSTASISIMEKK